MTRNQWISRLAWAGATTALFVAVLGAYVRLNHAGLGCPDWPVCYGKITWPTQAEDIMAANEAFPERPVETGKAWREQVHRFFAAGLGVVVLALALVANWAQPRRRLIVAGGAIAATAGTFSYIFGAVGLSVAFSVVAIGLPLAGAILWRGDGPGRLAAGLLALIIFQAMLGMWTVTMLLKPAIVTAHLLGGLSTVTLLVCLAGMTTPALRQRAVDYGTRKLTWIALVVVVMQIFLGGWTSTNYAALACPDFPTCQGQWWPETDLAEGFVLWRGVGVDYEGGVLDATARTGIHWVHRLGAIVVTLVVGLLALRLVTASRLRFHGVALAGALLLQLGLGVWNVVGGLPLWVATAHNGGAALLLAALVLLLVRFAPERARVPAPAAGSDVTGGVAHAEPAP